LLQLAAGLRGEVEQGPERAGSELTVARAPEHAYVVELLGERLDQRRLADPCLTRDQDQVSSSLARLPRVLAQRGELSLALSQLHVHSLDLQREMRTWDARITG
jgi:hypothetical protein